MSAWLFVYFQDTDSETSHRSLLTDNRLFVEVSLCDGSTPF